MFMAVALALSLCSIGRGDATSGAVVHTQNPLVAQYNVALSPGSSAVVEFGPDTNYGFVTAPVAASAPMVPVLVAGMKQNSTYHMRAVITRADGTKTFDSDHTFTTGTAPASRMPVMAVTQAAGVAPTPGVELVALNPPPYNPGNLLRVVALNPDGDLIWYYDFDPHLGTAQPIKLLRNGHFLMVLFGGTTGPGGMVREIDLAGRIIHEFTVDQLNQWLAVAGYPWKANAIHHDIVELPNGHLLVLVNTRKSYTGLRGPRGKISILGDAIVDLNQNYKPVWSWSSFDHLDVNRHPMLFPDWTHANTIGYSPDDGNIVLSLRNQSWVIKIDYANGRGTGNVLWRLGYQGDFKLLDSNSPADWFFAQHDANFFRANDSRELRLAVFDNGNNRFPDFSGHICPSTEGQPQYTWPAVFGRHVPDCYSRPAIFEVNEAARTARLLWSDVVAYSYWGGVTAQLWNNNIFFDDSSPSEQIIRLARLQRSRAKTIIEELGILCLVLVVFFFRMPIAFLPFAAISVAVVVALAPALGLIAVGIGLLADSMIVVMGPGRAAGNADSSDAPQPAFTGLQRINRPSFFVVVAVAISFLPIFAPQEKLNARVTEVTPQQPAQLIWQLDVSGQESYRTIHLPSLYPDVQW
jgi:arylsulfate sulfotransferase